MKHSKIRVDKYLSVSFPVRNSLHKEMLYLYCFSNLLLEYAIRKVQANQVELKLSDTNQHLPYVDDVNLLGYNINTINRRTDTLIYTSKEVGLLVNVQKTEEWCLLGCYAVWLL
jgi:hypothetical protein